MASSCQDVSARMMELLYGELSGDDRATLETHLAGCASCRSELAGFETTRAAARRALDADEPPARARQAILRAAAAAVAAKQPKPSAERAVPPRPSFWERWRARWTLPTFATVGAVAVVVLASKVFLEPDKTVELGRHATPAEAPATPTTAAEPQATAKAHAPARSIAPPTTQRRHKAPADGLGALGGLAKGGVGPTRPKAELSEELGALQDKATTPPAAPQPAKRAFAPPPPPPAEPSGPSPTAANQMKARDTEEDSLEESARASRGRVAAGAGAAPPAAHAKAKKVELPSALDDLERGPAAPAPAPAAPPARAAEERKADAKSGTSAELKPVESPVVRADRLFAQGQWAAAARAYRDLLRRDPHNDDAARWRQRLAASEEAASAAARAAASPSR